MLPGAILFACDHNAVRSPMAEGLMKRLYGTRAYVQSAGVTSDGEVDGFAIAVCQEVGVELSRHRTRSFAELKSLGDDLASFDLVVALSDASHRLATDLARAHGVAVEHWPIPDPTGRGEGREERLRAYREARDDLRARMVGRWGEGGGLAPPRPLTP